jgi:hypothetical protein
MNEDGKSRESLEVEANRVRAKLLRTVEQLDQRRHDAVDMHVQIGRHTKQIAIAGGLLVAAAAGVVALAVQRVASAPDRRRRGRWRLVQHLWQQPDRALRAERRSFFAELVRSLVFAAASSALSIPIRHAVGALVDGKDDERSGASPAR